MKFLAGFSTWLFTAALAAPVHGLDDWALERWLTPMDYASDTESIRYSRIESASQDWNLCVAYPHLKDAYWLSVNYGMVQEARRLGVSFRLVEAGGYPNIDRQIEQITECMREGADALVIGTVSYDGLTETLLEIAQGRPVIATVNDIASDGISAKSGVSWVQMGAAAGLAIAKRHPKGSPPVKLAWFPGPEGAGWVRFVQQGFEEALQQSSARIVVTKWGDTGREIQVRLVEEALIERPDVDYIVGSAPAAEAAVSILRARGLSDKIGIVSDYMTHAVFRGIRRGRILSAPTDFPVLQGQLAIEQAVRALEGKLEISHVGPRVVIVDRDNLDEIGADGSLAPPAFQPMFRLN
ncbi:TMAO reductase system periplasmic protein TorT [uncultured Roseovarius sp.]|uniref:TMAO reductase system periplasmic protein TorT n=1 Tax=uncultured Roseovarius sp. TaxID=293344 RepID=UPI0026265132|nr:TMAO reductase system periplasmic protein TorT [uncultured Roseovarius sp.]